MLRDNAWKLRGIVNGMDYREWSPEHDPFLGSDGYQRYSVDTLKEGKAACKVALQRVLFHSSSDPSLWSFAEKWAVYLCLQKAQDSSHSQTSLHLNGCKVKDVHNNDRLVNNWAYGTHITHFTHL